MASRTLVVAMISDATLHDRSMPKALKARNTAHNIIRSVTSDVLIWFRIRTDTQTIEDLIFYFKGSGVRYFFFGSSGHRRNFILMHYDIAKLSKLLMLKED